MEHEKLDFNISTLVQIYVRIIDELMAIELEGNRTIYVETNQGKYINFMPNSFRKKTTQVVGADNMNEVLRYFQKLRWIITTEKDKFAAIQWIKGKSMRVICIDKEVYETVKKINGNNSK